MQCACNYSQFLAGVKALRERNGTVPVPPIGGTESGNMALAPIAMRLQIGSGGGVCLPFVNRSGNEATHKKMEQKHDHETAGKSEHKPSHVHVWIKQGVEHE